MQPDQRLTWFFKASEILRGAHYVSTNRSERFARITLSWTPVEARLYVDGLLMGVIDRTDQGSDRFSTIYVGNFIGSALYGFMGNYFVRNLIVARTPVVFKVPPLVEHVMQIGDSFSAGAPLVSVFAKYDGTISNTIIGQLAQRGIGYRKYTVYSHGGGNVQDNGPKALEADVSGSGKTRAEALTENPTLVLFITAGNDRGIFDETRYMTDLRDHVEAFLGENGHMATTVKQVIVTTIASNLLATDPAILSMNQIMRSLPGWWDSTYPHKAGSVSVVDMWDIFGGANVDHSLFGISDPVHPAANGNIVYGRAISEQLLTFTGTGSM
jgi:hypothetical protein